MNHRSLKPLPLILGTAMVLGSVAASATEFQVIDLASGYQVASAGEGKMAEGSCGEGKMSEGSCGEGKGAMMKDANKDGKLSMEEHRAYWDEQFTKTDSNKDGFVTPAEMKTAMMGHEKGMEGSCGEKK